MSSARLSFVSCLALVALFQLTGRRAAAQLLVDNGGPRNIFYLDKDFSAAQAKLDTVDRSLSFSYFGAPKARNIILGVAAKVSAIESVEDLFKFDRWPGMEASVFGNWWFTRPRGSNPAAPAIPRASSGTLPDGTTAPVVGNTLQGNADIFSITTRLNVNYAEYLIVDPVGTAAPRRARRESFPAGMASVTGSWVFHADHAVALSVGVSRETNYADLPKVKISSTGGTLPDGTAIEGLSETTSARIGPLEKFTTFPLFLTYTYVTPIDFLSRLLVPKQDPRNSYDFVLAPYYRLSPRNSGSSENAIGLNVTLRTITSGKLGRRAKREDNEQQLAFPFAVFVERRNVGNSRESETKAGAAVVFTYK